MSCAAIKQPALKWTQQRGSETSNKSRAYERQSSPQNAALPFGLSYFGG